MLCPKKFLRAAWPGVFVALGIFVCVAADEARGQVATFGTNDSSATEPVAKRQRWPSARLALDSAEAVQSGQFSPSVEMQEVKFSAPVTGRFFCLETLSAHDGRAYAAVAELDLLDAAGRPLSRAGWQIAYVDSEEREREDGAAENAVDGDPATYWHTQWSSAAPNHPHHLVLDLGRAQTISGFRYVPRPGEGSVGGRIKDYRVWVGDNLVEANSLEAALPATCFLFSYFTGGGDDGLHLAYSLNGYRWVAMDHDRSFLKPEVGKDKLMRDPCLLRAPDGTFHLVWTDSWTGDSIGYASSKDLIHWSPTRAIPVMAGEPATMNCWAPEIFWDAGQSQFLIFWASTVTNKFLNTVGAGSPDNHRIYCTTTKDFNSFTPTRLFYDPGFSVIDPTLLAMSNHFCLVFKDAAKGRLRLAIGDHPEGPFGPPGPLFAPENVEGPMVFKLGAQFFIGFHVLRPDVYGVVKSADLEHWENFSAAMFFPSGSHQGTVLEVPGATLRPLIQDSRLEVGTTSQASELGIGSWIWATNLTDKQTCRLWREFDIPNDAKILRAELRLTADNDYTAYLDGQEIGRGGDVNYLTEYDLTWLLRPGRHVLAVEAFNETLDAGVILGLRVKLADGKKIEVFSDSSWRVAADNDKHWRTRREADSSWPNAGIVGYAGQAWWQYPTKIIQAPPVQPPASHVWLDWVLGVLLLLCLAGAILSVRLGLRLTLQSRAQRLLERERARIARDIHDDLGYGLTELTLLGELALCDPPGADQARGRLTELCTKARALLRSMDEIVWAVNPKRDTVQDFAAFICERAEEFLATTRIRCRQEVAAELPGIPLDLPQRRNLMLAVKEAIRNAARHSEATELNLKVHVVEQNLKVVVADNGKGFSPATLRTARNGLANLQQRLADIGGTCTIVSAPGEGCRVTFLLPLLMQKGK